MNMMRLMMIGLMSACVSQFAYANSDAPKEKVLPLEKDPTSLKVMAWNIWGRTNMSDKYKINGVTARQRALNILKESGADIICMQETYGSAAFIAEALGYDYYTTGSRANLCIFSKYPLVDDGATPGHSSGSFIKATVVLPSGKKVRVHNVHLSPGGLHLQYLRSSDVSDQDAVNADKAHRFASINPYLNNESIQADLANADEIPVIFAGDFNWVSHLDHTAETKAAGLNDDRILAVPTSLLMAERGFSDTYRACYPVVTKKTLGYTWSTVGVEWTWVPDRDFIPATGKEGEEPFGLYGRIDYIYSRGAMLTPKASEVIATYRTDAVSNFPDFPSDHAAVLTTFTLTP